jgi:competence protein ComEA
VAFERHPCAPWRDDRRVAQLSRSQILVYGAIAVALLLVGARWIRSADASGESPGGVEAAATGGDEAGGGIALGGDGDVVVHVAGAVGDPGVYRLPTGSRVTDAVDRAGGPTAKAELDSVNLAAEVADGQQVVIPGAAPSTGAATTAGSGEASSPISLGTATLEELDTIEGIGPVTAQNILDFRAENGGISSVEDLDQISGIGPATMEALRSSLQP